MAASLLMIILRVTVHIAVVLIFIIAISLRSVFTCNMVRGTVKVNYGGGRKTQETSPNETRNRSTRNHGGIPFSYLLCDSVQHCRFTLILALAVLYSNSPLSASWSQGA